MFSFLSVGERLSCLRSNSPLPALEKRSRYCAAVREVRSSPTLFLLSFLYVVWLLKVSNLLRYCLRRTVFSALGITFCSLQKAGKYGTLTCLPLQNLKRRYELSNCSSPPLAARCCYALCCFVVCVCCRCVQK